MREYREGRRGRRGRGKITSWEEERKRRKRRRKKSVKKKGNGMSGVKLEINEQRRDKEREERKYQEGNKLDYGKRQDGRRVTTGKYCVASRKGRERGVLPG